MLMKFTANFGQFEKSVNHKFQSQALSYPAKEKLLDTWERVFRSFSSDDIALVYIIWLSSTKLFATVRLRDVTTYMIKQFFTR